jgi:hypothetical protein
MSNFFKIPSDGSKTRPWMRGVTISASLHETIHELMGGREREREEERAANLVLFK